MTKVMSSGPPPSRVDASFRAKRGRVIWPLIGLIYVVLLYRGGVGRGVIVGGDWNTWAFQPSANHLFPFPALWIPDNLGSSNLTGASLYPIESIAGLLGHLGIDYGLAERILFYFPVVLAGYWGVYFLFGKARVGAAMRSIAATAYVASVPYVVFVVGGWFTILMGAALLPWALFALGQFIERPTWYHSLVLGAILGLAMWFDPRNGYLIGVGLVTYLTIEVSQRSKRLQLRRALSSPWLPLAPVLVLLLQSQWLLPLFMGVKTGIPASYSTASAAQGFSFNSLGDALSLFNYAWPHLHLGVSIPVPVLWLIWPLLAAVALRGTRELQALWACALYLVYAFLAAGANPPFGSLYVWLYAHVPGMSVYRDSSVFLVPAVLGPVLLLGMLSSAVLHQGKLGDRIKFQAHQRRLSVWGFTVLLVAVGATTVVGDVPAFAGQWSGTLVTQRVPADVQNVNEYLASSAPGAALWIPDTSSFAARSLALHPNIDAGILTQRLPGVVSGAPSSEADWLSVPTEVSATLSTLNIRYVVIALDVGKYLSLSSNPSALVRSLTGQFCSSGCKRFGTFEIAAVRHINGSPVAFVQGSQYCPRARRAPVPNNGASQKLHTRLIAYQSTGTNDWTIELAAGSCGYLILWQSYDSGWQAIEQGSGTHLAHTEKARWANAYFVPASVRTITLQLRYGAEQWLDMGMLISMGTMLGIVTCGIGVLLRRIVARGHLPQR